MVDSWGHLSHAWADSQEDFTLLILYPSHLPGCPPVLICLPMGGGGDGTYIAYLATRSKHDQMYMKV